LHAIAYPTIQAAKGRRTLVFAAGQEHAEKLTAAFNAYEGVEAEYVIDKTDRLERRKIIQRFRDRTTQVLVNCMVFTEGFDVPDAAVCANARPTKSTSLYQQMIGRVTRPEAGVVDGLGTDEAGNASRCCILMPKTGFWELRTFLRAP
ncbi:MAG: helicase-related protein, partial [Desulfosalsimonadaceae bacterium]